MAPQKNQKQLDERYLNLERKFEEMLKSATDKIESKLSNIQSTPETVPSDVIPGLRAEWLKEMDMIKAVTQSQLDEIKSLIEREVQPLHEKIDSLEQYTRRNCLIVHGLAESPGEDTTKLSVSTINNRLNLAYKIDANDIDRCHRLHSNNPRHKNSRPVIIKFISYGVRDEVWRSKKALKGSTVSITESLTKIRMQLLRRCQQIAGKRSVWTQDGKIIVLSPNGVKKYVVTERDLVCLDNIFN